MQLNIDCLNINRKGELYMEKKVYFIYHVETNELIAHSERLGEALSYLTDKKYRMCAVDAMEVWRSYWKDLHAEEGI